MLSQLYGALVSTHTCDHVVVPCWRNWPVTEATPLPLPSAAVIGTDTVPRSAPGAGIEPDAGALVRDVNAVGHADEIRAAGVGTGLMGRVVIKRTHAGKRGFPQETAGVDVHRPQDVHAFDEDAALTDLWLGAVAVAGEDGFIRGAAEPEEAEGGFDDGVFGDAGVGGVGVLVRPVGAAGQGAFANEERHVAGLLPSCSRQVGNARCRCRQAGHAAKWPQAGKYLGDKFRLPGCGQ